MKTKLLLTALFLALIGTSLIAVAPASSLGGGECPEGSPAFCGDIELPGTGNGDNNGGGGSGGGPQTPPTGKYWWFVEPSYGPCENSGKLYAAYSTWLPSPDAPIVDPAGPDTVQCVRPRHDDSGPSVVLPPIEDLRAEARLMLVPANITSDFSSCLITQTEVTFTADSPETLTKDLDVPGFHVWLEAHPVSFGWTFDERADAVAASGREVKTTYHEKTANGSGDHTANIALTVVWDGELHINQLTSGGESEVRVDQLGTVPVESHLERALVEVWSAQTKTNPHATEGEAVQCP